MKTIWQKFHGPNYGYILELYERYQANPEAVDAVTRSAFEQFGPPPANLEALHPQNGSNGIEAVLKTPPPVSPATDVDSMSQAAAVRNLALTIREYGHLDARLDPLGVASPPGDPALDAAYYHLTDDDLRRLPASLVEGAASEEAANALEAIEALRRVYSTHIGYDYDHIRLPDERDWLREAAESRRFSPQKRPIRNEYLLKQLTKIEAFEQFCHRTFPGKTRFSIEGLDMMVPVLHRMVGWAASHGYHNISLGMAHRGRLNVLAHLLYKDYANILTEFKDPLQDDNANTGWSGDVKYHAGNQIFLTNINPDFVAEGSDESVNLSISMAPNPSHLEHVNPVVVGMARAAGANLDKPGAPNFDTHRSLSILIHGDASFTGQGIVSETFNMYRLNGYSTGGTIHIIANNQVGFTTDPHDARSTLYASDVAKGYKIPIVHVNADDPEACIEVARLAIAYLIRFGKDFVIDLIGYRRWGHNEGDEPRFTQPMLYKVIEEHPTVRDQWVETMIERGEITADDAAAQKQAHLDKLQKIYETVTLQPADIEPTLELPPEGAARRVKTKVAAETLHTLNESLLAVPEDFTVFPGVRRLLRRQQEALSEPDTASIEWGFAEALALASILADGTPIRLTGEDAERGTFGHRHAVLNDTATGQRFTLLQNLPQAQAAFEIHNSPLTENAAVGFEYGFSIQKPECLVIWEAQYGDFINGAQAIIDEFLVSGWAKWNQRSGLVLLLPHGYEGKGPDHSSGRLERFLQLAGETNIRVVNCTTPAQFFHLLRRQAALLKEDPLPLIVMAPKSLLRERLLYSTPRELSEGQWQPVIDDAQARENPEVIRRVILCSGKIYADLLKHDQRENTSELALVRLEQLYTFPGDDVREVLEGYPNLEEVVWLQEEPKNMGAWEFVAPYLNEIIAGRWPLTYLGRPRSASPAEGSTTLHQVNQAVLISRAYTLGEDSAA